MNLYRTQDKKPDFLLSTMRTNINRLSPTNENAKKFIRDSSKILTARGPSEKTQLLKKVQVLMRKEPNTHRAIEKSLNKCKNLVNYMSQNNNVIKNPRTDQFPCDFTQTTSFEKFCQHKKQGSENKLIRLKRKERKKEGNRWIKNAVNY